MSDIKWSADDTTLCVCGHEHNRHDPEDGLCDAPCGDPLKPETTRCWKFRPAVPSLPPEAVDKQRNSADLWLATGLSPDERVEFLYNAGYVTYEGWPKVSAAIREALTAQSEAREKAEAELLVLNHERALIAATVESERTDCSTPIFQMVRNLKERAEKAGARVGELEQWKREAIEVMKNWDSVTAYLQTNFEVVDWGRTWQGAVIRRLNDRATLAASLRDVQETLKAHEWSGGGLAENPRCRVCSWNKNEGHHASCWLSSLLTRLSTDTKEEK